MTHQSNRNNRSCQKSHWQAHVNTLNKSGLSRAEYCRQHDLSYYAMTYWQKKLSSPNKTKTTLVPVLLKQNRQQSPHCSNRPSLKIILPGNLSVEVPDHFSSTTLTRLLTTLEKR